MGSVEAPRAGGTRGAEGEMRSLRLSLTDLSFGIPPAKRFPN